MKETNNEISKLELSQEALYSQILSHVIEMEARLVALTATVAQLTAHLLPEETEKIKQLAKEKYNAEKTEIISALEKAHGQNG